MSNMKHHLGQHMQITFLQGKVGHLEHVIAQMLCDRDQLLRQQAQYRVDDAKKRAKVAAMVKSLRNENKLLRLQVSNLESQNQILTKQNAFPQKKAENSDVNNDDRNSTRKRPELFDTTDEPPKKIQKRVPVKSKKTKKKVTWALHAEGTINEAPSGAVQVRPRTGNVEANHPGEYIDASFERFCVRACALSGIAENARVKAQCESTFTVDYYIG